MGSSKDEVGTLIVTTEEETTEAEDNHSGEAHNDQIETGNNLVLSVVIRSDPVSFNNVQQRTRFAINVQNEGTTQDSVIPQTLMPSVKKQIMK